MSYFVFIVSSRNNPIYEQFDIMRRGQMNELGIPHKFLLNGVLPEGYQLKDDEEYHEDTSFTPGMFRKFYDACKTLYSTNNTKQRNLGFALNGLGPQNFNEQGYIPKQTLRLPIQGASVRQ